MPNCSKVSEISSLLYESPKYRRGHPSNIEALGSPQPNNSAGNRLLLGWCWGTDIHGNGEIWEQPVGSIQFPDIHIYPEPLPMIPLLAYLSFLQKKGWTSHKIGVLSLPCCIFKNPNPFPSSKRGRTHWSIANPQIANGWASQAPGDSEPRSPRSRSSNKGGGGGDFQGLSKRRIFGAIFIGIL